MKPADTRNSITRRRFLASSSALAAAGPMMLTGRAWAQANPADPTVAANDQITLGVIGLGKRGENLLRSYFCKDKQFRVLAVAEVEDARRTRAVDFINRVYGNQDCAAYLDYQEMIARDDIDAIVIATPDHWHTIQVIQAAMAGKDIYSEKPLTHNLHESKVIIEAVNKFNIVLQTGSQQRSDFNKRFATAAQYIRAGRLGKIQQVHINVRETPIWCDLPTQDTPQGLDWDRWLGPAPMRGYHTDLAPPGMPGGYPKWRAYREYCGGYLADMGAHQFDIAQWALGKDGTTPTHIIPPADETANTGAELIYDDGVKLIHGGGEVGAGGLTFIGEKGMLAVERPRIKSDPELILEEPLTDDEQTLVRPANHGADWANCIRSREKPICSVEVGAGSAAVCQLTNMAYFTREELRWDPVKWEFTNSEQANRLRDREWRAGFELPKF